MERVRIAALFADKEQYGGASVTVCGWAKTIRDMKTFGFIELNDGSCFRNLQVVMDANSLSNYKEIAAQNVGAALIVRGTVVLTPEAKQPLEVKATEIEVEGVSSPDYPLQKKRHSVEYLRTIQHLRPRTNLFSAAFRVRSAAAYAVHEFFQSRGFVYVNTPIITGSDCEGAGEMFQVTTLDLENPPRTPDGKVDYSKDFFGKKTSLTVSGQLNAENFAMAFGDVYTFGPTFRAENSNTARHAAEFWMIEPEMAFCDLDGDLEVMEAMVKHIIRRVMERCPDDLVFFNSFVDKGLLERLQHVESSDFGRVTYTEAVKPVIERLKETGWTFGSHTWGHIRLDTKPLQTVINDTERWADEVGSLVGPTQILFYPHGGRPDGDDWHQTGERFQYLQSQGFRIFASVGTSSFSYVKPDISAVICDRLHPDGTTLRHSRSRYLQFYNAEDIMDTQVRPDLGVDW